MNFLDNFQFQDFNYENNAYDKNNGHYIGLNRVTDNKKNFFFEPNQMNIMNNNQYTKISNNRKIYRNNLNKSTDINDSRTLNPSIIRQNMEKLNNKIKKLNGLFQQKNNLSKTKSNGYISDTNKGLKSRTNYIFLRNNQNQSNLSSNQKMNQTYKINNNINKNYYITYDLKRMKFNFNNNNNNNKDLHSKNDYSDNEISSGKFSKSIKSAKNKGNIYGFSNKSDFNITNFELSKYDYNKYNKSNSIYKGLQYNNNFEINVNDFSIKNNNINEKIPNNSFNYRHLKSDLLVNSNNNQNRKYMVYNPKKQQNNHYQSKNMSAGNNSETSNFMLNINEMKNNNNYNNFQNINNDNDNDNSDELSELAEDIIEAFNLDTNNEEENFEKFKRTKSSNIQNNNNTNFKDLLFNNDRNKEINMTDIKKIPQASPKFMENKGNIKLNLKELKIEKEDKKEKKPLNESIELEQSLIHDSQLDIPLIKETLIYNKVMKNNKQDKEDKIKKVQQNINKNINIPVKNEAMIIKEKDNNHINNINDIYLNSKLCED